ncbi:hypothetical protein M2447_002330 [Ereboglobus sp. PH5-10]|uniref:hypothetical protein n=1 Tax=Ereboglobus sp. PH5-10 TaxID=2940629 RepID=UPI002404DF15|nr:hypothetical protein [Ereboglobus sp. PH5-10]MDF9828212.1 hypothetical protein [Ereboglobus sp. PH5-10]
MFDFIKNLFRPKQKQLLPTLTDSLFGPLVHFPAAGLWAGQTQFPPVEGEVEILIEADDSGPGETQRAFFNELVSRWPEVQSAIGEILFPPMKKWAKRDYDESNPWSYFDLRGIRIPSLTTEPAEWAISYWCPSVKHHFDVQMSGWTPDGLDISRK